MDIEFLPTQYAALTTPANEVLFGGQVGGGKSFMLRYAAILYGMYIPGLTIVLFRRRYRDLLQNHWHGNYSLPHILEPFQEIGKCNINHTDYRVDFKHDHGRPDSKLFLRHLQHSKDVENYQGMEIGLCLWDELSQFPEKVYTYILTRVRLGSLKIDYEEVQKYLPWVKPGPNGEAPLPKVIGATNPGGIGGAFIKKRWIDPAPPEQLWDAPLKEGGMRRVFFPSRLQDNSFLLKEDPLYAQRVRGAGSATARALLDGDWSLTEGTALGDIWEESIHIIPQLKIPKNAAVYRGLDWGTFHPSVILYALQTNGEILETVTGEKIILPKRSLIIFHEIYNWDQEDQNAGNRKPATEVGRQIAEFESSVAWFDNIIVGPADRQIFQQRGGTHDTIDNLIREGYNNYMQDLARNSKDFSWKLDVNILFEEADQSSGSRVTGLSLVRDFLEGALKYFNEGEDHKGLYFTENVRHCITTIPDIPRSETNPEDSETKNVPDHAYDVVRYFCISQAEEFQFLDIRGL